MNRAITINGRLSIPVSELQFRFARSGGKGGQNVNKVETKVELLFDVARSPSLSATERERVQKHLLSRIDSEGVLHIVAQESRSQWKNRETALERFAELLRETLKPRKKRIATKMTTAAREKRLEGKKRRTKIIHSRRIEE